MAGRADCALNEAVLGCGSGAVRRAFMGRPAGSFTVALGDHLKARLLAAAQTAGTSAAVVARRAIGRALRDRADQESLLVHLAAPDEPLQEIRVNVPQSAAERLAAAARFAGMTRSAYVSAAAVHLAERWGASPRAAAQSSPVEAAGALRDALVKSNATLAPIGRNLNQVARALNMHPGLMSGPDREKLGEIADRVSEHLQHASELLQAIRAPRFRAAR